ncbi:MAG: GTP pyrophosphokinase family protein [Clostridiaceae bacterium]
MGLQMFTFIEDTSVYLKSLKSKLIDASDELENYFEDLLVSTENEYLNINSRIKSTNSLKEKIIRNNYYLKYSSPEDLISNLSDLIGVRVECRFIDDEKKLYKILKKSFNISHEDGYYYNSINENIRLDLSPSQPQDQKNGFKIYKIDGHYQCENNIFNFELQIKSLVNIFWGEIEHKVIYKNNNYLVGDNFMKVILASIKKNLSMIDNQLLLIDENFNKINAIDPEVRKAQLETLLSKMIYDIYSSKMKNELGFLVDYRKSCDAIMKYIFRSNRAENLEDYNLTLIKTLTRLNEITNNKIEFNSKIEFERDINFEDEFSSILGNSIVGSINSDFQWNVFFRILFEIEVGTNCEDFENFIKFIRNRLYENKSFTKLFLMLPEDNALSIINSLMLEIAKSYKTVNSITFVYDYNVEDINKTLENMVNIILANINSFEEWESAQDIYLELFQLKILSIFNCKMEKYKIEDFIEKVKYNSPKLKINVGILDYVDKLEKIVKFNNDEIMELFRI